MTLKWPLKGKKRSSLVYLYSRLWASIVCCTGTGSEVDECGNTEVVIRELLCVHKLFYSSIICQNWLLVNHDCWSCQIKTLEPLCTCLEHALICYLLLQSVCHEGSNYIVCGLWTVYHGMFSDGNDLYKFVILTSNHLSDEDLDFYLNSNFMWFWSWNHFLITWTHFSIS